MVNRSAIDSLCELKPTPVKVVESTMTTSMPTMVGATATVPVKPAAQTPPKGGKRRLSQLLLRRNLRQEGALDQPVIPTDAKPDETSSGVPNEKGKEEPPKNGGPQGPLISTSIALVAPDTTPDGEMPLDPGQVPQPLSSETPVVSSPTPIDNGQDVLRTLIGTHQEHFKPELIANIQDAGAAIEHAVNAEPGGEKSSTATEAASKVISEAQSGKKLEPYHNPDSLRRGIAVTRQILGM
jgi:hypothetical protein